MKFRPQSAAISKGTLHVPGPGSYDPNASAIKFNQEAAKIGSSLRSNNGATKDQLQNPGPGAYEMERGLLKANAAKVGTG